MLFLDTSALLRRYLSEDGTQHVLGAMGADADWVVSALAPVEAAITLCHVGFEAELSSELRRRVRSDIADFLVVPVDAACLRDAVDIGCERRVRTLVAIHLAAARRLPPPVTFLTFDQRQAAAAGAMGFLLPTDQATPDR